MWACNQIVKTVSVYKDIKDVSDIPVILMLSQFNLFQCSSYYLNENFESDEKNLQGQPAIYFCSLEITPWFVDLFTFSKNNALSKHLTLYYWWRFRGEASKQIIKIWRFKTVTFSFQKRNIFLLDLNFLPATDLIFIFIFTSIRKAFENWYADLYEKRRAR